MFGPSMKPTIVNPQELLDIDDLNERVLESAAIVSHALAVPETIPGNTNITVWDESPGAAGHRAATAPARNEETIAEQLVDAGNDEADEEQRLSAALNQSAREQG